MSGEHPNGREAIDRIIRDAKADGTIRDDKSREWVERKAREAAIQFERQRNK